MSLSLIEQFWQTASASTPENEEMEITVTIDGKVKVVSVASIRRHLKLEDSDGISTLPNAKIFKQLAFIRVKDQQSQLNIGECLMIHMISDQPKEQLGVFSAAKVLTDVASTVGPGTKRLKFHIPSPVATKDKGKVVMQESEQPKKIKKRVQIQMSIDEELAQKLHEEEQARFNVEQEAKKQSLMKNKNPKRLDYEAAMRIQEELDESERQRIAQVHQEA
ncbi:hypothetical protein Tco_0360301 [Tanacetum coccineum]